MTRHRRPAHLLAVFLLLCITLWAAGLAQAQTNSRQAVEAARKHRAEQDARAPQQRRAELDRPYRSSADPTADPNASLRSCLDHSGMNVVARDRCMRQHCNGRWGQGDCPAGGNVLQQTTPNRNTPLGQCLATAGANPFKREACGWRHCNWSWDKPAECAALKPRQQRDWRSKAGRHPQALRGRRPFRRPARPPRRQVARRPAAATGCRHAAPERPAPARVPARRARQRRAAGSSLPAGAGAG